MSIITSLLQRLLLVAVLAMSLTMSVATNDFDGCLSGRVSIDNMEESIKRGITETVKIVEPVYDAKVKSYLRTYLERYPVYTEELLARAEFYFPVETIIPLVFYPRKTGPLRKVGAPGVILKVFFLFWIPQV